MATRLIWISRNHVGTLVRARFFGRFARRHFYDQVVRRRDFMSLRRSGEERRRKEMVDGPIIIWSPSTRKELKGPEE